MVQRCDCAPRIYRTYADCGALVTIEGRVCEVAAARKAMRDAKQLAEGQQPGRTRAEQATQRAQAWATFELAKAHYEILEDHHFSEHQDTVRQAGP